MRARTRSVVGAFNGFKGAQPPFKPLSPLDPHSRVQEKWFKGDSKDPKNQLGARLKQ
jgi:hypothetical protein